MNTSEILQELKNINDRITMQNDTMAAMWKRWDAMFEREKWFMEAYPEIVAQHQAIEDLKRASKETQVEQQMGFGGAIPKGEGQVVNYDGNI